MQDTRQELIELIQKSMSITWEEVSCVVENLLENFNIEKKGK